MDEYINPDLMIHKNILAVQDTKKTPVTVNLSGKKVSRPYMTKYERARILGTRAMQISLGSRIVTECSELSDPLLIAEKELSDGVLPIIIRRYIPDGSHEDFMANELIMEEN